MPAPTKVIVTTRHRLDIAYPVRLTGMKPTDAKEFIGDECRKKNVSLTSYQVEKLIKRTGGIPLAIVWSIAQMGFGYDPEVILERLGWQTSDIAKFCFEGVIDQIRGTSAYQLLMALAYLDNEVDRETLGKISGLATLDRDEGLVLLEKLSLINKREDRFYTLPLTLAYIKVELQDHPNIWLELTDPYLEKYLRFAKESLGTVHMLGANARKHLNSNFFTPSLALLRSTSMQRASLRELVNHFSERDSFSLLESKTVDALELLEDINRIFIIGKPGSGKTTLLQRIALEFLNGDPKKIPIFILLREVSDFDSSLFNYIVDKFKIVEFPAPDIYVSQMLETGNVVILLDGLDEVSQSNNQRSKLRREIERFATIYPLCKIVVTSRIAATEYVFPQFTYVELVDLNKEQVRSFIQTWFSEQPKRAEELWQIIQSSPHGSLHEFTFTPLLLSLLCLTFSEYERLPIDRVDLYKVSVQALLTTWDSSRDIRRDNTLRFLSFRNQQLLLAFIAANTFEREEYFFPEHFAEELIVKFLLNQTELDEHGVDGIAILKSMEVQHGLIVQRTQGLYSFITLSFHEYFAAYHYSNVANNNDLRDLVPHILERRWREIFVLLCAMITNPVGFISTCFDQLHIYLGQNERVRVLVTSVKSHYENDDSLNFSSKWIKIREELENENSPRINKLETSNLEMLRALVSGYDTLIECLQVADLHNEDRQMIEESFLSS